MIPNLFWLVLEHPNLTLTVWLLLTLAAVPLVCTLCTGFSPTAAWHLWADAKRPWRVVMLRCGVFARWFVWDVGPALTAEQKAKSRLHPGNRRRIFIGVPMLYVEQTATCRRVGLWMCGHAVWLEVTD
jgi:hypothetical protein